MRPLKPLIYIINIFLCLHSFGQEKLHQLDEKVHSFLMVKPSLLVGDDLTCGSVGVPQVIIARRNFKSISLNPALSFGRMFYSDCDGASHEAWTLSVGTIINAQFLKYGHFRNQLFYGAQTSNHSGDRYIGEATLGVGLTIWRVEGSLDFGYAKYDGDGYPAFKLGLGYIFSSANSINP